MLARLLERLPSLRFLATGRHPVGLPSERVWPLAPLVAPPAEAETTMAAIAAYPAVGLFLDRLARVRRTQLEPDEIAPLATLVRRLGGLPLAIELAAARGRVLTIPEILDRYGDRVLDLDRPGSADPSPETPVSLRDAVAASYRLLNPGEQRALRRLAMFRYRWSLASAEQITDGAQTDGSDVVHLLDRLLELGLLSVRGTRTFRFRLLDVVRDYAAERAAAAGELTEARRRHALVLAGLAQQIAPDLIGTNLAEAASRLDDVAGDLGAALTFAAGEDPHTALRIAAALPRWWRFRGRDVSGRQWLRRLLDDPRTADADPQVRAWAKVGLAQLALEHGAGAEEIGSATAAVAEFERLRSLAGQLTAHTQLAALWMTTGGYADARRHGEAALDLARRSGKIRDIAVAENNLTWHEIREGDLAAARRRLAAVDELASRVRRGTAAGGGAGQPGRGGAARRAPGGGRAAGPQRDARAGADRRPGPPAPAVRHGRAGAGRVRAGGGGAGAARPSCACRASCRRTGRPRWSRRRSRCDRASGSTRPSASPAPPRRTKGRTTRGTWWRPWSG